MTIETLLLIIIGLQIALFPFLYFLVSTIDGQIVDAANAIVRNKG